MNTLVIHSDPRKGVMATSPTQDLALLVTRAIYVSTSSLSPSNPYYQDRDGKRQYARDTGFRYALPARNPQTIPIALRKHASSTILRAILYPRTLDLQEKNRKNLLACEGHHLFLTENHETSTKVED